MDALRSLGRKVDGRDALDGQLAERGRHHRQQRQGRPQAAERSRARIACQISRDLGVGEASLKVVVIGDPYHQRDLSAPLEGRRRN